MEQLEQSKKVNWILMVAILIAGVMSLGMFISARDKQSVIQRSSTSIKRSRAAASVKYGEIPPIGGQEAILGNLKAPVTFIEYGDYQCPFCGRFFLQVEPLLRNDYIKTDKMQMVFRNFQILGTESEAAAAAAECAKDQDKFWAYHDELYKVETTDRRENNGNLNRDLFLKLAENVGLDITTFASCLESKKYIDLVKKETAEGLNLGISGTPTSFINGKPVIGAQPYSVFKNVIDIALQEK